MDSSLIMAHISFKLVCMLLRPVWREACLNILIRDMVFVLLYVEAGTSKKMLKNHKSYAFLSQNKNEGLNIKSETLFPR